jgi:hypothetical protein
MVAEILFFFLCRGIETKFEKNKKPKKRSIYRGRAKNVVTGLRKRKSKVIQKGFR